MHLLIADDHLDVRTRITGIIRESFPEAELFVYSSGTEVLEHLVSHKCDLIIMDIKMPGVSGIEVLRSVRSSKTLPVIMISSQPDEQYSSALLRAGANAFITKQSMSEMLIPAIEHLVKIR
jgi:DNA-binding NarL/FixJ family response regulator